MILFNLGFVLFALLHSGHCQYLTSGPCSSCTNPLGCHGCPYPVQPTIPPFQFAQSSCSACYEPRPCSYCPQTTTRIVCPNHCPQPITVPSCIPCAITTKRPTPPLPPPICSPCYLPRPCFGCRQPSFIPECPRNCPHILTPPPCIPCAPITLPPRPPPHISCSSCQIPVPCSGCPQPTTPRPACPSTCPQIHTPPPCQQCPLAVKRCPISTIKSCYLTRDNCLNNDSCPNGQICCQVNCIRQCI